MGNVSDKVVEKIKTPLYIPKMFVVYEKRWKNIVRSDWPQMKI
jgi:hypothetical protein